MTIYSASYTWRALQELFDSRKDRLDEVLEDETGEALEEYFREMVPGDSPEEVHDNIKVLENLAYKVSQTIEDDFEVLKNLVKREPRIVQKVFSPADCRIIISAFEANETPKLSFPELTIGIYLVLVSGEQELKNFDVLDILIEAETPSAEAYQAELDAAAAVEKEAESASEA